jgi:hypothetical protein
MTDHRRKGKRVLRRDRPRKPRRPPIPAPKIESGIRPEGRMYDEMEIVGGDLEVLLDAEFDE